MELESPGSGIMQILARLILSNLIEETSDASMPSAAHASVFP
jgi:hypothetical protein